MRYLHLFFTSLLHRYRHLRGFTASLIAVQPTWRVIKWLITYLLEKYRDNLEFLINLLIPLYLRAKPISNLYEKVIIFIFLYSLYFTSNRSSVENKTSSCKTLISSIYFINSNSSPFFERRSQHALVILIVCNRVDTSRGPTEERYSREINPCDLNESGEDKKYVLFLYSSGFIDVGFSSRLNRREG